MEIVRAAQPKKKTGRPRGKVDKHMKLLALVHGVFLGRYTPESFNRLLDEAGATNELKAFCHYVRPPQPAKEVDPIDKLTPAQVNEMYAQLEKLAK